MIKVDVITPEKLAISEEVDFIAAPASDGEVGILPGHAPLLTKLGIGELRLKKGNDIKFIAVAGGFLEVQSGDRVAIFAETAELSEEINEERARLAAERAKQHIKELKDPSQLNLLEAEAALNRAIIRLKVAQVKKVKAPRDLH